MSFTYLKTTHSYHLVDPSPWPIISAFGAFMLTVGRVLYMHKFNGGWELFITGFILILYIMYTWWRGICPVGNLATRYCKFFNKKIKIFGTQHQAALGLVWDLNDPDIINLFTFISINLGVTLLLTALFINFLTNYSKFDKTLIAEQLQEFYRNLKIDIKKLKVSKTSMVLVTGYSITAVLLLNYSHIKLALLCIIFAVAALIKNFPSVKILHEEQNQNNTEIREIYKKNYRSIYYFSRFIKFVFICSLIHFVVYCIIYKSYQWVDLFLKGDLPVLLSELGESAQNLLLRFSLFVNALLFDFSVESFIIYSECSRHILGVRLIWHTVSRSWRMASYALGGFTSVGVCVAYTPLVEIPGVNEFQVRLGRGYGYRTSMDYGVGMIYQRYFTKDQLAQLIQERGPRDKILDGIFFKMLSEDKSVAQILNKSATVNELRLLGLRRF